MPHYKAGTWNCICDVCGFEFKSDELKKRWDGLMVCAKDYETRHPQDLLRVRPEHNHLPFIRHEPPDHFIGLHCPFPSLYAAADIGTADCARVIIVLPPYIL